MRSWTNRTNVYSSVGQTALGRYRFGFERLFDGRVGDQLRIAINREEVEIGLRSIVILLADHILEQTVEVSLRSSSSRAYIRIFDDFDGIIVILLIELVKLRSHVSMFVLGR